MGTAEQLQIIITAGPEDAQRATLGFSLAAAASACGTPLVLFLAMNGVQWVCKSTANQPASPGLQPISELLDSIQEAGGRVEVCSNCMQGSCPSSGICGGLQNLRSGIETAGLTGVALRMSTSPTVTF